RWDRAKELRTTRDFRGIAALYFPTDNMPVNGVYQRFIAEEYWAGRWDYARELSQQMKLNEEVVLRQSGGSTMDVQTIVEQMSRILSEGRSFAEDVRQWQHSSGFAGLFISTDEMPRNRVYQNLIAEEYWTARWRCAQAYRGQNNPDAILKIYQPEEPMINNRMYQSFIAEEYWNTLWAQAKEYNSRREYEKVKGLLNRDHQSIPVNEIYVKLIKGLDHAMSSTGGIDLSQQDAAMHVTKDAQGGLRITVDKALIAQIEQEGLSEAIPVIIRMAPANPNTLF
ncbi:MAG: hypothetical protein HQL13_01365, partial [Candidatus Omnitrophica bacterium]|nr:hypothetical protein [Candidatus Omnitrophota bacterium]